MTKQNGKKAENAPQNDIPEVETTSAWDEIPRCFGYAIGAMMASGFMGGLIGYVWYAFTH